MCPVSESRNLSKQILTDDCRLLAVARVIAEAGTVPTPTSSALPGPSQDQDTNEQVSQCGRGRPWCGGLVYVNISTFIAVSLMLAVPRPFLAFFNADPELLAMTGWGFIGLLAGDGAGRPADGRDASRVSQPQSASAVRSRSAFSRR